MVKNKRGQKHAVSGELSRNEPGYLHLFLTSPLPMWIFDIETLGFLAVNQAAIQHYGYSEAEFLAKTLKDIRPKEDLPALLEKVKTPAYGIDEAGVWRHQKKDGSIIDVEITSHDLVFMGRPAELVVARDVTKMRTVQRHLLESIDQKNRNLDSLKVERKLREKLVSTLAHDIRAPLTAARASAELLKRHPGRQDLQVSLPVRIIECLDRIDRMMRDMLDVSRWRAGQKLSLHAEKCDLTQLLGRIREELAIVHGERIRLRCQSTVTVNWDRDAIRRIIENLVDNAVKYGEPVTPITISAELTSDSTIKVSVHNMGKPIPEELRTEIFEQYARADSEPARGWGLGLALVQGLTEAHGGRIQFTSSNEEGTTFTVTIPRDRPVQG